MDDFSQLLRIRNHPQGISIANAGVEHKNTLPRGGCIRLGAVAPRAALPTRQGVR